MVGRKRKADNQNQIPIRQPILPEIVRLLMPDQREKDEQFADRRELYKGRVLQEVEKSQGPPKKLSVTQKYFFSFGKINKYWPI